MSTASEKKNLLDLRKSVRDERAALTDTMSKVGVGHAHGRGGFPTEPSMVWISASIPFSVEIAGEDVGVGGRHALAAEEESAPGVGMSDAIFDIVSSGGTLISNGLTEVEKVFFSEAVLIAAPGLDRAKRTEVGQLTFRFNSILDSRDMKYVLMNPATGTARRGHPGSCPACAVRRCCRWPKRAGARSMP